MNVTLSTGPLTTAWNPTLLAFPETVKLVIVVLQVAALATGIALTTGKNKRVNSIKILSIRFTFSYSIAKVYNFFSLFM
ncbi:hypothetical protein DU80_06115 [Methanosarcina mazei]|uniref:Uncharacterized protein n=1 Tax=Methanosarcina mazei TaxID=2209 RepID=A0A0F8PPZ3_METMZ|nr:hypothetical protein DU47_19115 [Methanosarcina mazei]KKG04298.1 hypothetical protein DU40_18315 [Methanosarcina mazei]KKG04887.1 hypothetical protein DU31_19620 [Methanosarcina mazei]KKG12769.1 hypothetical protein DU34_00590 [Methanosarcina mazei]KKG34347.1 hypothetical protein DU49_18395 [Methanosarcina mazei]